MCIVEIKTTDNRKLTCFVSCSRQVASSGEANCSGVIRTRRSTVISPNSTCRKSTCKKKERKLLTTKDRLWGGEMGERGGRDDTVVRACAWIWVPEENPFLDWVCCWFSSLRPVSRKCRWLSRPEIKHWNQNLKNKDVVLSRQTRSFCFA